MVYIEIYINQYKYYANPQWTYGFKEKARLKPL